MDNPGMRAAGQGGGNSTLHNDLAASALFAMQASKELVFPPHVVMAAAATNMAIASKAGYAGGGVYNGQDAQQKLQRSRERNRMHARKTRQRKKLQMQVRPILVALFFSFCSVLACVGRHQLSSSRGDLGWYLHRYERKKKKKLNETKLEILPQYPLTPPISLPPSLSLSLSLSDPTSARRRAQAGASSPQANDQ